MPAVSVSDSGPLIAFSRIGRLDILEQLFNTIWIPDAVYYEVGADGRSWPGSQTIASSTCIQRRTVSDLSLMQRFPGNIHAGEGEAIVLALELERPLLIDERRGRSFAATLGIHVFGSLRVIAEAYRQEMLTDPGSLVAAMIRSGYWIDHRLLETLIDNLDTRV